MPQSNRDRMIAAALTALLILGLMLWMAMSRFSIDMSLLTERTWPPVDSSEIVFGGEFVKMGDMADLTVADNAQPNSATSPEAAAHQGSDAVDAGEASPEPPAVVTSQRPSPAKVEKKEAPAKTGPTKEELAEQQRIKREKEQAQQSEKISTGMKNAFAKPSAAAGTSGSPSGNASEGAVSGSPGYSLKGRTAESWGRPSSAYSGKIIIAVKVNRQGVVTQASYQGGSGSAAAQSSVRNSCIAAARQSRFSVDEDAPAEQSGTITWTFR
jgi:hypothetical protein